MLSAISSGKCTMEQGKGEMGALRSRESYSCMRLQKILMGVPLKKKNVKKSFTNCDFAHPLEGDLWVVAGCAGY